MEKQEVRAVIKYLYLKGKKTAEILEEMKETLGDNAPAYSTITKFIRLFKTGHMSTEDYPITGRPIEVTTQENIDKVHDMILNDRRIHIHHIVNELELSYGVVHRIIHDHLGLVKLSARWVPRMLTADQKRRRVTVCTELLGRFQQDPENFLKRLITQDETWVHHFDPETKIQSKEWHTKGSRPPKKFKRRPSAGKVMVTVFWDYEGPIMVDFLDRGETINAEYYSDELRRLKPQIVSKRRGKQRAGVMLLQDNATPHTAQLSVTTAAQCGYEILPHPAYSPDLAPSDFFLFPKLKEKLRGVHFDDEDEVIHAVTTFLEDQDSSFYRDGLMALEKRWIAFINRQGDYVEK